MRKSHSSLGYELEVGDDRITDGFASPDDNNPHLSKITIIQISCCPKKINQSLYLMWVTKSKVRNCIKEDDMR